MIVLRLTPPPPLEDVSSDCKISVEVNTTLLYFWGVKGVKGVSAYSSPPSSAAPLRPGDWGFIIWGAGMAPLLLPLVFPPFDLKGEVEGGSDAVACGGKHGSDAELLSFVVCPSTFPNSTRSSYPRPEEFGWIKRGLGILLPTTLAPLTLLEEEMEGLPPIVLPIVCEWKAAEAAAAAAAEAAAALPLR